MARPQVFGRERRGTVRGRDAEFPSAPVPVSSLEKSREALPRPPHYHASAHPSRGTVDNRPSTSGGTSTRKVKAVQKQETRDDLHFSPHPGVEVSTTYYNFPLPSSLPTPTASPRSSPPRVVSPEFSEPEVIESNVLAPMEIGMALGSPSHQPVAWNSSKVNYERPRLIDSPESMDQVDDWKQAALQPKPKASKWKKFGGLFGGGKKNTGQPQAFYQLQPERGESMPVSSEMDQHYTTFPSPPSSAERPRTRGGEERPRTRGRTNTVSEKKTKQKPELKRSQTAPLDFNFQNQEDVPKASKYETMKTPEIQLDGGPMLNVDIPRIELERYSIMFGSLLTAKPSGQTSSNLLARRQATLDKLKLVNEAIAEHERHEAEAKSKLLRPRRATSPQPTKSPAFSLFPTTPHGTRARSGSRSGSPMTPRRTSPLMGGSLTLHRSNTSPAALSPNRQTFAKSLHEDLAPPRPLEETHTIMLAPTPPPIQQEQPQKRAHRAPASHSPWSEHESHLVLSPSSSTASDNEEMEIHVPQPLKPVLVEPSWEMVPPPQGVKSPDSAATGRSKPLPSRAQSSRHPEENTRLASPLARNPSQSHANPATRRAQPQAQAQPLLQSYYQEESSSNSTRNVGSSARRVRSEEDAQAAAEASIARQISVSQQQRKLLLPITTRGAGVKSAGGSAASTPVSAVKQMTPTVVNVQGGRRVEGEVAVFERA